LDSISTIYFPSTFHLPSPTQPERKLFLPLNLKATLHQAQSPNSPPYQRPSPRNQIIPSLPVFGFAWYNKTRQYTSTPPPFSPPPFSPPPFLFSLPQEAKMHNSRHGYEGHGAHAHAMLQMVLYCDVYYILNYAPLPQAASSSSSLHRPCAMDLSASAPCAASCAPFRLDRIAPPPPSPPPLQVAHLQVAPIIDISLSQPPRSPAPVHFPFHYLCFSHRHFPGLFHRLCSPFARPLCRAPTPYSAISSSLRLYDLFNRGRVWRVERREALA